MDDYKIHLLKQNFRTVKGSSVECGHDPKNNNHNATTDLGGVTCQDCIDKTYSVKIEVKK